MAREVKEVKEERVDYIMDKEVKVEIDRKEDHTIWI